MNVHRVVTKQATFLFDHIHLISLIRIDIKKIIITLISFKLLNYYVSTIEAHK